MTVTARDGRHVHDARVGGAVAGRVGGKGVNRLTEIGEICREVVAVQVGRRGARIDVGDVVALIEEVFEDPVAGFAGAAGDENARFRHRVSLEVNEQMLASVVFGFIERAFDVVQNAFDEGEGEDFGAVDTLLAGQGLLYNVHFSGNRINLGDVLHLDGDGLVGGRKPRFIGPRFGWEVEGDSFGFPEPGSHL